VGQEIGSVQGGHTEGVSIYRSVLATDQRRVKTSAKLSKASSNQDSQRDLTLAASGK